MGAWVMTNVDGLYNLRSVSCPSIAICVAVDNLGNMVVGAAPPVHPISVRPFVMHATIGHVRFRSLLVSGLPVTVRCSQACTATVVVRLSASGSRAAGLGRARGRKPKAAVVGRVTATVPAGKARIVHVPLKRRLREFSNVTLTATTTAVYHGGHAATTTAVRVRR